MLQSGRQEGVAGELPLPRHAFRAFDTLNVVCADCAPDLFRCVEDLCLRLHSVFDRFDAQSEVSRMECAAESPFACSSDMEAVLRVSQALHGESGGAFNPALVPVMDLWGFGDGCARVPGGAQLASVLERCDFSQVRLSREGFVRVPRGMRLDFGGIVKGYAAECAQAMLRQAGVASGFVDFGGTVAVIGPKPDGSPWSFGLQEGGAAYGSTFWAVLRGAEGAFATSAGYYRSLQGAGGRVNHILDPRTGRPVSNGVAEATVHCAGATMADALSTALFAMGPHEGMELACSLGAQALFRMEDGKVHATPGFPVRRMGGCR